MSLLVIHLKKHKLFLECLVCFLFGTILIKAILKAFIVLQLILDKFMLIMFLQQSA